MKYLIISFLFCMVVSCKNKSNGTNQTIESTSEDQVVSCGIKIGFFSRGSGIDRDVLKKLDAYLIEEKENNLLDYTIAQKGREGERKYCVAFVTGKKSIIEKIKKDIEAIISTTDLVRLL